VQGVGRENRVNDIIPICTELTSCSPTLIQMVEGSSSA
jgi:hypothetical protein